MVGREECRRARVSGSGANETKRGQIESFYAFYRVIGVCWRSTTPAATAGRGLGVAVASSRASSVEDEDDDVSLVFIHAKRYVGPWWAESAGLLGGLHGQVRSW
jgi:hypothetical protein